MPHQIEILAAATSLALGLSTGSSQASAAAAPSNQREMTPAG
ncbi:hypothetical protein [Herbiconiux daphne]|uniref:Uncharacterized protein n=1 Tax=Herbiconiux daphne TaxID=2970914 RepID=A0ABT2H0N5_9MICO|nr:hypothetical protein [Herbiconiux daphne]MCS5733497.1 hypothetical protein [Herbiconiux daphne]